MAHFVVHIKDATGYSAADQLGKAGLGSLVDDVLGPATEEAEVDGVPGRLIRWDDPFRTERNAAPGVEGKQWWTDIHGNSIGWDADNPPTPIDLLRHRMYDNSPQLDSFPADLDDGNTWLVPLARRLPDAWTQDRDGRPRLAPKRQFAWYWDEVTQFIARMAAGEFAPDDPPEDAFWLAVRALSMNYRICPEVVYATGLLAACDPIKIIAAAGEHSLDYTMEIKYHVQKKTPHLAASA